MTWSHQQHRPGRSPKRVSRWQPVADVSGFPEMLDGRVRTLHPAIHAASSLVATIPTTCQLAESRYEPIDLVVVSLYPFAETLARGADDDTIVETSTSAGHMIRAAAKNRDSVTVVVAAAQSMPSRRAARHMVPSPRRRATRLAAEGVHARRRVRHGGRSMVARRAPARPCPPS